MTSSEDCFTPPPPPTEVSCNILAPTSSSGASYV